MSTGSASSATASTDAMALLNGTGDVDAALEQLREMLPAVEPWQAPPAEVGILMSALAAVRPDAIPEEIGALLASVITRADLSRTAQPAVDEAFQLFDLLMASPAASVLPTLVDHVVCVPEVHPRWLRAALGLLQSFDEWQPGALNADALIETAEQIPSCSATTLFHAVIGPLLLADPAACDLKLLQRAARLPNEPSVARYVLNALAGHEATPPNVRAWATSAIADCFPLRPVWRRLFSTHGLRALCVQNIADGQGDEMVRVVPLLQALFDDHPETRITLITDRAYLYSHPRLELISFDEPERIALALNERYDGLIEFFESQTPHLNHDTDLAEAIAAYREQHAPLFDLRAAKGWNRFEFDSVRIDGFEWAAGLRLNERLNESVYDPAVRLIAELGLPVATGVRSFAEPVLAHESLLDRIWERTSDDEAARRPIALLNPFGGSDALKGFVPQKFDDLVTLIHMLIDEGFDVLLCPTGSAWGSRTLIDDLRARLPEDIRRYTGISPDPATSTSPSAAMRDIISLVAQVDLVVTIEGWMMHAASLNGKPYRLLLMPASGERNWQPWGHARGQHVWCFQGDPALDNPPCPERPRRAAWLALLGRINDPDCYETLRAIAESPDREIRLAALRALGRLGRRDLRSHFAPLLDDPSYAIRALAAEVLLERAPAGSDGPERLILEGYRALGQVPYGGWEMITNLRSSALPALRAALHDAGPVMRREAALVLEQFSRSLESANGVAV